MFKERAEGKEVAPSRIWHPTKYVFSAAAASSQSATGARRLRRFIVRKYLRLAAFRASLEYRTVKRRKRRARVPGRCLVYRDERFPTGACDANRSRTARSSPQGGGAKGWKANVRPKEHKWAVRQDVGGEQASTREAQESLTAFCRAQRRERKEQTLTRGDPGVERPRGVSRGRSSD